MSSWCPKFPAFGFPQNSTTCLDRGGLASSSCCQGIWNRCGGAWHVRACGVMLMVVFAVFVIHHSWTFSSIECIHVLEDAGFCYLILLLSPDATFLLSLCEAYNVLLKGLVLQRNFKSAEDWLKTMQKVQLAPKLGTGSTMQFQSILYNIAYRMRVGVDKNNVLVGENRFRAFRANSVPQLWMLWGSTQLSNFKTTCCLGGNACELRSFCTKERDHLYHPSWTLDCEKDVASLRKGTWYPDLY